MTLIGRLFDEGTIGRVGLALERAFGAVDERPPDAERVPLTRRPGARTMSPKASSAGRAPADPSVLYEDLDRELDSTRRVLERFPDGKNDWRPHEKSRTLGELAGHVAGIPGLGATILATDELDRSGRPAMPSAGTAAELLAAFDANVAKLRAALATLDAGGLDRTWTMRMGGRVLVQNPKRVLMRVMVLSHLVHHRAQLGGYYRLLNVPVPSVYGPTADEAV